MNQTPLKSELFSSSKYADVAWLSGPIKQAAAIPAMWPPSALQQIKALAPCRSSVRGFLLSQMVSPVLVSLHTGILVASVSGQEMMGEDMTWHLLSDYSRIIHSIGVPRTNIPIITQHTSNIPEFFSIKAKTYCDRWSVIHTTQHLRKECVD